MKALTNLPVEQMREVAIQKVYGALLDGSRAQRNGRTLDAGEYHHQAFIMAQGYEAIGLMESDEITKLESEAEDQAIKEWKEKRDNHQLIEEEASNIRQWIKEQAREAHQWGEANAYKGKKGLVVNASGRELGYAFAISAIKAGKTVADRIAYMQKDVEEAEERIYKAENIKDLRMGKGEAIAYKQVRDYLMDYPYRD